MFDRARNQTDRRFAACAALAALCAGLTACSDGQAPPARDASPQGACERDCLISLLDQHLAAVVAHDPAASPLAEDFRATQNAVEMAPGEGVWSTITGLGALQRRYADADTGQAGFIGLVGEGAQPAIVALRIAAEDRRITEAEWVIVREGMAMFNPAGLTANPPPPDSARGEAAGRDAALAAAETYYEGIESADPAVVLARPGCYRAENGTWMVGMMPGREPVDRAEAQPGLTTPLSPEEDSSCLSGFENLDAVTAAVRDRGYFYDETAGVVWSSGVFERTEGAVGRDGAPVPWLYFNSVFPIEAGQVRGLHAVMIYLPPDVTGSGWPQDRPNSAQ